MPPLQVAAAIFQRGTPVYTLALRKAHGVFEGYWEFPGGKQEPGETLQECLYREIYEELGVSISVGLCVGTSDYQGGVGSAKSSTERHIQLHGFIVTQWSGEIKLTEHNAMLWLPISDLLCLRWSPADIPIVKAIVER